MISLKTLFNLSFIEQACSVKVAGYWTLFCIFIELDLVVVYKNATTTTTTTTTTWSISNDLVHASLVSRIHKFYL